jgi:hypothetical protein
MQLTHSLRSRVADSSDEDFVMSVEIIATLITVSGGFILASISYWLTKKKEIEAELRQQKVKHYMDFVLALNGIIAEQTTQKGQIDFATAFNNLYLFAPQAVIDALHEYSNQIDPSNPNRSSQEHNRLLTKLFFEIRKDLRVYPPDNEETFKVWLRGSGQR